jgi:amidophosphoribosyltransferase
MADTVTMEKNRTFSDDEVTDLYQECKNNGLNKRGFCNCRKDVAKF